MYYKYYLYTFYSEDYKVIHSSEVAPYSWVKTSHWLWYL